MITKIWFCSKHYATAMLIDNLWNIDNWRKTSSCNDHCILCKHFYQCGTGKRQLRKLGKLKKCILCGCRYICIFTVK